MTGLLTQTTALPCAIREVLLIRRTGLEREREQRVARYRSTYLLTHAHTREGRLTCLRLHLLYLRALSTVARLHRLYIFHAHNIDVHYFQHALHMRRFTSTVPACGARALNRAISNSCLWY